jgi:acetyl-CoA carboxylase biotin carboxyl carrier protein
MAKKAAKQTPASRAPDGAAADLDILRELVALLDASSATEIKLQRGDASYAVSKGGGIPVPVFTPAMGHAHLHAPGAGTPPAPAAPAAAAGAPAAASNLVDIKSPMVGTFYRSPEPGAEPYVKAGSRIAPGQTLCIIEAMKIMNELESEVAGTVREILVEDAQPVEFGQVLFRVEP